MLKQQKNYCRGISQIYNNIPIDTKIHKILLENIQTIDMT